MSKKMILTNEEIKAIRHEALSRTYKDVGDEFGIDGSSVYNILTGRSFAQIPDGIVPKQKLREVRTNFVTSEHMKAIGSMGGRAKRTKPAGFAYMKASGQIEKIRAAGQKGGRISRRGKRNDS